jgi:hypothetical protein
MCSRRARMSLGCPLQWQLSVSGSWPFRRPRKTASLPAKHGRLTFNFTSATSPRAPKGPDEHLGPCMRSRPMRLFPVPLYVARQRRQTTTDTLANLQQRSASLIRRSNEMAASAQQTQGGLSSPHGTSGRHNRLGGLMDWRGRRSLQHVDLNAGLERLVHISAIRVIADDDYAYERAGFFESGLRLGSHLERASRCSGIRYRDATLQRLGWQLAHFRPQ